jgi:hypothetical protein
MTRLGVHEVDAHCIYEAQSSSVTSTWGRVHKEAAMSKVGCAGCKGGDALPFDFTMAFHPIVDIAQGSVLGLRGAS